ncbi:hypothetical protein KSP39_PZI011215 [Platanthera zijinensis]|uniref:Uncharacterized protein n=1 Tax=Platanthera zijinensis TaxID=2320716 RepID=A0AAP0BHK0_9ASPA
MASRIASNWLRKGRGMATAAAAPISGGKAKPIGEFVPVYVALGLILVSASLGAHTIYTQLSYNPSVRLNKKRRETVLEVEDPERVAEEGVGYINHSIFRKVAHKQDFDAVRAGISDPMRAKDVSLKSARMESLKSVGVDPRSHAA